MRGKHRPLLIPVGGPLDFDDPRRADDDGLVAIGGDLSPERLLHAYRSGVFPWYDVGLPPLWWCPNPRTVIDPEGLHISRSMSRVMRAQCFELSLDRSFGRVIRSCADRPEQGTWILPEMIAAYEELHRLGHAHSVEVWQGDNLVGGLYGVKCGGLFAAESMFHTAPNASKLALIESVRGFFSAGLRLFDVQFLTPHLSRMGARTLSRVEYLERLAVAVATPVAALRLPEPSQRSCY